MVSLQEKIRNLSMGIAVSSIVSTGSPHAQQTPAPDKIPTPIEQNNGWQHITHPSMSYIKGLSNDEIAKTYTKEYIEGLGELYWVAHNQAHFTPEQRKQESLKQQETAYSDGLVIRNRPVFSVAPNDVVEKLKQKPEIEITHQFPDNYLYLQKEDYIRLCRYQSSQKIASDCLNLVSAQPEKVDKLLPGTSDFIKNNVSDLRATKLNTSYSAASLRTIQKHILKNFNKISPDFNQQMEQNYSQRGNKHPTLNKLTPEGFYVMIDTDWPIAFESPKIQQDVQQVSDILAIEPDSNVSTPQQKKNTAADTISRLRGKTDSTKTNKSTYSKFKNSIKKTKDSFKQLKESLNQLKQR
jgi:hypothetical protein